MAVTPITRVPSDVLTSLDARLAGEAITERHPGYDRARRVWNGMIDRQPALIARCADAADVVACVNFARERELPVAVRGVATAWPATLSATAVW
jgi:FAD/FMN-containing dehydrogenase